MKIILENGSEAETVATFNNGSSHIIIDNGCYVIVNRTPVIQFEANRPIIGDFYRMSAWIFSEALEALKQLPSPK